MRQNYWRIFATAVIKNWNKPALTDYYLPDDGYKDLQNLSYSYGEMCREMLRLREVFQLIGLKKGDHVAICGANCTHWIIAYLAIVAYQGVVVTILNVQSTEDIAHQIDFSDAKLLIADSEVWMNLKKHSLPNIQCVISMDDWSICHSNLKRIQTGTLPMRKHRNSFILMLLNLWRMYVSFSRKHPNDLSVICFTSGSTSNAKGVMVAHRVYPAGGALLLSRLRAPIDNRNVMAILPFGHVFGLVDVNSALYSGSHVFIVKSIIHPSTLIKSMMHIRPYRIMLIPMLVDGLIAAGKEDLLRHCSEFLKYGIAGGAVVPSETIEKLLSINFPITIGYGQTEASPLISISSPSKYKKGSCGQVIPNCKVCISPEGEILVKGDNVMLGYYKDPEATAAKIDSDGWLHTGDKGHLDNDGYLYVEGRLEQDIIVLPNGENIRPDHIESFINALPEVSESLVLARDGHLVAIVVPESPYTIHHTPYTEVADLRRKILRAVNPQLPLFSQLYDVEIIDTPLQRTEKQTIKRYLYK